MADTADSKILNFKSFYTVGNTGLAYFCPSNSLTVKVGILYFHMCIAISAYVCFCVIKSFVYYFEVLGLLCVRVPILFLFVCILCIYACSVLVCIYVCV